MPRTYSRPVCDNCKNEERFKVTWENSIFSVVCLECHKAILEVDTEGIPIYFESTEKQ